MLPEPTSTSAAAGFAAASILLAVGPDGTHAVIVFGALIGVMHSVGRADTRTHFAAAWYVVKWVLTASLLTGFVSALLVQHMGLPADRWPGVVAFGLTFLADRWPGWAAAVLRTRLGVPADAQETRK